MEIHDDGDDVCSRELEVRAGKEEEKVTCFPPSIQEKNSLSSHVEGKIVPRVLYFIWPLPYFHEGAPWRELL